MYDGTTSKSSSISSSRVDTGVDTLGSGFHLWKRRTAMKNYPRSPEPLDVVDLVAIVVISCLIAIMLFSWFGARGA